MIKRLLLPSFLACALAACGTPPKSDLKFSEIRAQIFTISCTLSASCHNASGKMGGLDLQTNPHAALINAEVSNAKAKSNGWKEVVPRNLATSFLYQKLILPTASDPELGLRMPSSSPPMDADRLEAIKKWIERGAPND